MIGKYNGKALETIEKIMDDVNSWYTNKLYFNSKYNIYWFMNQNGYMHILRPCNIIFNNKTTGYCITDYLITKDNLMKENKTIGNYKKIEDVINYLEKEVNYETML